MSKRLGRDILPKEFGGKGQTLAEMTASWWKELCANRARLEAMDTLVVSRGKTYVFTYIEYLWSLQMRVGGGGGATAPSSKMKGPLNKLLTFFSR